MNFRDRYGALDRLFHRLAFRLGTAQQALADVEDLVHGSRLRSISPDAPVFITALPRAGTSILLRVLNRTGRFASHTYRDMPFVLCPLFWSRFSRAFGADDGGPSAERAHGDGLRVSADTPEAFAEMIWKHFWPGHYRDDRIVPWRAGEESAEFEDFFEMHMRKIIDLRRRNPEDDRRYLSKNNVDLCRLGARQGPLRAGTLLVPYRDPLQHAASMQKQHERFLELHDDDPFVREYMEAVGHHDFGRTLKPIDFGGWLDGAPPPDGAEFWVRYWIAAYRFVLEHADDRVALVSYRRLTSRPEETLRRLATAIEVPEAELAREAGRLHPPRRHEVDASGLPAKVRNGADALHQRLRERTRV